ncbi:S1 domain-containing RNA-binding protein [Fructilactobacillus frigidiflavus]|uniref:S1 domain-containing RNA-binding protein n=1 Tax=Fructilactobacillus frigidiflavus TaxID=3242688 RepID=UPI00375701F2
MALKVGDIVTGKVSGITGFGAFVDLEDHKNGLVHISEVSDGFIKDIHDVLTVGDEVKVKVMKIGDDGKIGLSIRAASDKPKASGKPQRASRPQAHGARPHASHSKPEKFDDLLSNFLKKSESRLSDIKKNTEGKRGGRGGRRS